MNGGLMVTVERIEWIRRKHILDIGERENSQLRVDQVDDLFIAIDERDAEIEQLKQRIENHVVEFHEAFDIYHNLLNIGEKNPEAIPELRKELDDVTIDMSLWYIFVQAADGYSEENDTSH